MELGMENGASYKEQEEEEEEEEGLGWGKSLPVQSVQELVRRDPSSVPERYIRDHAERPKDRGVVSAITPDIPVIDFSLLSGGHEDERKRLDLACKEWGFFQIINHGVEEDLLCRIRKAMGGFFNLSYEEKKKHAMAPNDVHGYGQAFVVSEEQKLDWNDLLYIIVEPTEQRRMKYWPIIVPDFKDAVDMYSTKIKRIAEELLGNISLLMNMKRDELLAMHGTWKLSMRMNYYPPCSRPDDVLGVSPHSDGSSITILLQEDDIPGLQIKYKGEWIPVKPIPNALVINIGDSLEAWSNGMYESIEHRALTNKDSARMSLATFVNPDENADIGPVDQMIDEIHRPRMYKTIKHIDFLRHFFSKKLEGKTHTHVLKLDNKE
ncbi:protein SRG1-like [Ananas comosus]|uniref:Protein SRG1-like n=2 Tax=Ananas comosus TaxID=4615 RepID=A0A6P5ER55_ANACO|nr:protein SRG1-like [Ananas comosus]